ncbi:MAG: hypothetical protein K0R38_4371, partial [Polyangiaceae bacterium]|nr:hypothetical protein [Polyangiaceae bacterium]
MPPVTKAQLDHAVAILQRARGGARASSELSRAISSEQLGPGQSEQLSSLVYAALRRERRVVAVLRELGADVSGPHAARLMVIGAGLLEASPLFEPEEARAAWSEVSWQRFLQTDATLLARTRGVEKVALLGSLPDFLAQLLHSEY